MLDTDALGACSQEKPVNYIVRGGDHLKFLVEQCGGTDSLEARRQLFSDDELQRWYNLEVSPGEKAGCLFPHSPHRTHQWALVQLYLQVTIALLSYPRGTECARIAASIDMQKQLLLDSGIICIPAGSMAEFSKQYDCQPCLPIRLLFHGLFAVTYCNVPLTAHC